MLLVLCVDLDDDLGRKTGFTTPVIGREPVEEAAIAMATADPEDSDANVIFQGLHVYDEIDARDESVEVAVVTGNEEGEVSASREIGDEVDTVLASLSTGEDVTTVVVTDGAQDESVLPVIRARVPVDGVRRVVVRQAQNLESMYYTIKQVMADPETRGTILIPLGILLLIYPLALVGALLDFPGLVIGSVSTLLGVYLISSGLGLGASLGGVATSLRRSLYAGRMTIIAYLVAIALVALGGVSGFETIESLGSTQEAVGLPIGAAAFLHGAIQWFGAAALTTSLGQLTDAYIGERLEWRYLNAPFYVVAMTVVLYAVSGFFVDQIDVAALATALTGGTVLAILSTLTFAIVESRISRDGSPRTVNVGE
ncbi:hypothetical protein C479_11580 [Halovivax asiaticus JCM 14624]|uniref:DUF373 family protein n=1 Tax=Halovivax asiaticus JCM 14624 TaxID=1227490 RepID=M0BEY8_9EURY|nr:DUF373 family protein [Halovivax asiaticus]ELZ09456.1 hypothetical protein C479_11580 [Halovivax asiaticus JCM 14624]